MTQGAFFLACCYKEKKGHEIFHDILVSKVTQYLHLFDAGVHYSEIFKPYLGT